MVSRRVPTRPVVRNLCDCAAVPADPGAAPPLVSVMSEAGAGPPCVSVISEAGGAPAPPLVMVIALSSNDRRGAARGAFVNVAPASPDAGAADGADGVDGWGCGSLPSSNDRVIDRR